MFVCVWLSVRIHFIGPFMTTSNTDAPPKTKVLVSAGRNAPLWSNQYSHILYTHQKYKEPSHTSLVCVLVCVCVLVSIESWHAHTTHKDTHMHMCVCVHVCLVVVLKFIHNTHTLHTHMCAMVCLCVCVCHFESWHTHTKTHHYTHAFVCMCLCHLKVNTYIHTHIVVAFKSSKLYTVGRSLCTCFRGNNHLPLSLKYTILAYVYHLYRIIHTFLVVWNSLFSCE